MRLSSLLLLAAASGCATLVLARSDSAMDHEIDFDFSEEADDPMSPISQKEEAAQDAQIDVLPAEPDSAIEGWHLYLELFEKYEHRI